MGRAGAVCFCRRVSGLLRLPLRPFGGREGFHGKGVQGFAFQAFAQGSVNLLVALDGALALKGGRDDEGEPVPAIALHLQVLAGQSGGDQGLDFFCVHVGVPL